MNTKRALIGLLMFFGAALAKAADVTPPGSINDLTVSSGPSSGSILLQWTATGDDNTTGTASSYVIKYLLNSTIDSTTSFSGATPVSNSPAPQASGSSEAFLVTGLTPGATYGFALRAFDDAFNASPLSNSATALAGLVCQKNANDGLGTASFAPSTIKTGAVTVATFTFMVGSPGINPGGIIAMKVPDGWPLPSTSTPAGFPGTVGTPTTNGTANLTAATSNQFILITVQSGPSLNVSEQVQINYVVQTCEPPGTVTVNSFSQYESCGVLTELASPPTVTVATGDPDTIFIDPYEQYVQVNTVSPVTLVMRDECFNEVTNNTGAINLNISADLLTTSFNPDPNAQLDVSPGFGSPFSSGTVTFPNSVSRLTLYYRITTTANQGDHFLDFNFPDIGGMGTEFRQARMIPLVNGITNASIDTGVLTAGQTSATFTPDFDGTNDSVFINFNLPDTESSLPPPRWIVLISSDGFSSIVRQFYGSGKDNRLSWDGQREFQPGIAPPATYAVKIMLDGGGITDTSLSATLQANGLSGTVLDDTGSNPLEDVEIDVFGPSHHFGLSNADGTFELYGLQIGDYTLRFRRDGYIPKEVPVTTVNGVLAIGNVLLDRASVIQIRAQRPDAGFLPELWGEVRAHTTDWSHETYAQLHFSEGATLSDAGDVWNQTPSTFTSLNLAPSLTYQVHFEVPSHGGVDFSTSLVVGQVTQHLEVLTRRANIEGQVRLPAGSNLSGQGKWISIEACQGGDCDTFDPSKRFYGGIYLPPGVEDGIYRVFGIPTGTFELRARAQGFVVQSTMTVVSSSADVTGVDFPVFSQGGTLSGTITITGDTGDLDSNDGSMDGVFRLPIHARSLVQPTDSFTEISIATSATGATTSYTLTGMVDGGYEVFAFLNGFESTPPGPKNATVSGGSGSLNITFNQNSGSLTGTIVLPGAKTNYSSATIRLVNFNGDPSQAPPGPTIVGNTYTFDKLGTGFYLVQARWPETGFIFERAVQLVNGQVSNLDINLAGLTYSISGRVSSASEDYPLLSDLVNTSTPTTFLDLETNVSTDIAANRIIAEKVDRDHNRPPDNGGGSPSSLPEFDPLKMYVGFYNAQTGTYTITNVPAGQYRLTFNGELDGDLDTGNEVAQISKSIVIYDSDLTGRDFTAIDGYDIDGTLKLAAGETESGRNLRVYLTDIDDAEISERIVFLSGTSVNYTLKGVPPGTYAVFVDDINYPVKYSADPLTVKVVAQDLSSQNITLKRAAKIQGQLIIKNSNTLITQQNSDLLPSGFTIEARGIDGGHFSSEQPIIGSNDKFSVAVKPGSYFLTMRTFGGFGSQDRASGQKPFVPITIGPLTVDAGETKDLVVNLYEGIPISGVVKDTNGNPLPNILIEAEPADRSRDFEPLEAFSDANGFWQIDGIDPGDSDRDGTRFYNVIASPRPDNHDLFLGFSGSRFAEVRKYVDTQNQTTDINFTLSEAKGSISGNIVTEDGGELSFPFGDAEGFRGALVLLNHQGVIPQDNPLGDIEGQSEPDGSFTVKGLQAGNYSLYVLSENYRSGFKGNIVVNDQDVDVGTITLNTGTRMYGTLTKSNGDRPNEEELDALVAARDGFKEILIGKFESDPSGFIESYELNGFQSDKSYSILAFDRDNNIFNLGSVTVSTPTEKNFILGAKTPDVFAQAFKESNNDMAIKFEFSGSIRNSQIDTDSDGLLDDSAEEIFTLIAGNGTLTIGPNSISSNRQRALMTYTPGSGDTSFTIRSNVTFNDEDPETGVNFTKTRDFQFFVGIGKSKSQKILNANSGDVNLDNDPSQFVTQPGTFGTNDSLEVEVTFRSAQTFDSFNATSAGIAAAKPLKVAEKIGLQAYPPEMSAAMSKLKAMDVEPLSSFYDIFLPASVSHFFPEGKEAQICLSYDSSVSNPDELNIYYYNSQSNEYLLEDQNKSVDTENKRICASIGHASVFTVLASSAPILAGDAYNGALTVMNFPNPFNLKSKTVTLQNPGSLTASQTIDGTMIKFSVPSSLNGAVKIEIYNILGERVRTLRSNVSTGGSHFYMEWDGRNDGGKKVASGTYLARFTIGGGNEIFFKMAVVK